MYVTVMFMDPISFVLGGPQYPTPEEKMEADLRSVYVGNVRSL